MAERFYCPSPYYRVAIKAMVFDDQHRLLVVQAEDKKWELPGGGLEHGEKERECVDREIQEELGVRVLSMSDVRWIFRGFNPDRQTHCLRLMVDAELESFDFTFGDGMVDARFVDPEAFMALDFVPDDASVVQHIDKIWA